jgi:hypothetical protein
MVSILIICHEFPKYSFKRCSNKIEKKIGEKKNPATYVICIQLFRHNFVYKSPMKNPRRERPWWTSTHIGTFTSILYGIGYQGKSRWKFSTKERSIFNGHLLDLRRFSETRRDKCSLWKIAEGLKDRPCVCIKNLQIFLRSLTLQMWKKEQ